MIDNLQNKFPDYDLKYSIGRQISFDVFPIGWDKSYCLQLISEKYDQIHFFGDKVHSGGNDYELYIDPRVIGHKVTSPKDTEATLKSLFITPLDNKSSNTNNVNDLIDETTLRSIPGDYVNLSITNTPSDLNDIISISRST